MMASSARNGAIEFWRFAFSVLIVMCHLYQLPSFFNSTVSATDNSQWFTGASIGVEFFFIVSGFLMASSAEKLKGLTTGEASMRFIIRKYLSFLPMLLFSYIVSFIVKFIMGFGTFGDLFWGSVFEIFCLQNSGLSPILNMSIPMINGSWYLSAMMISMALLFPLLYAKRDFFLNIAAPIIAVAITGYYCYEQESFKLLGTFRGVLRGVALISLGCFCYRITELIADKKLRPTKLLSVLLTVAELSCFISVAVCSWFMERNQWDFVAIFLLAIGVTISFSGMSYTPQMFKAPIFATLGKYSLAIYLNHTIWLVSLGYMNLQLGFKKEIIIVILMTATSSFLCVAVTDTLKCIAKSYSGNIRKLFIKEETK